MSNSYYTHGSFPSTGSAATSAAMRAELDLVTAGFDKLPMLTGNANALVTVNSAGTALTVASAASTVLGVADTNFTIQNATDASKKFQFLASGITSGTTRIYTMPDSDQTLVGRTTTDTLTNKTLTSPTISTILNTGTLTLPTSTDTLVGRNTTDTLTNKTLTLPTIASINNGGTILIPSGAGTLVTLTATQTLTNKTLTSPVIGTIINTGTLTLPTSTDTLVGRATTDTLTNKTLTAPIIASIVNTGVLTLPTSTDTLVGRATTDTLTNKTLTSPTISTILNTGTLTLPTSTDTLVGRATTDTLTNKTISGSSNTLSNIANASLTNSAVTVGTTSISLGASSLTLGGLTSVAVTQDPTTALQLATKQYVDTQTTTGLSFHDPVQASTTGTLASITGGTVTYANGTAGVGATLTLSVALTTLDGYTLVNGNRILVKNEATAANNGVYTWATGGTVLTRATDANSYGTGTTQIRQNSYFFTQNGVVNKGNSYVITTVGTITFGTTAIIFAQFSGSQTYTNGTGLTLISNTFAIDSTVVTLTGSQTLTNKTLTSPTINGATIATGTIDNTPIGGTTANTGAFTTLSASSTVSGTGFSTYLASPPAIGGTVAAAGAFTTLSASSTVSGTGFSTYLASPPAIGGTAAAAITGTTITANTGFAGPLNGTVGATTPSTGAFTTLSASSTVSGTGFSTYLASPPAIGGTAAAAGSFTTLSASSTVSGAGFSTYLASPPAIGGTAAAAGTFTTLGGTTITASVQFSGPHNGTVGATTPNTGAFTTLSASSTVSGTGFSTYLASPPAIGGTAAAAGSFTTLSASSTVSGTGFSTYLASPPAIGGTTPAAGSFTLLTKNAAARTGAALTTTAPAASYSSTSTYTDNTTAISGTAAFGTINSIGAATIAASNTSVTYTEAASLYLAGPPVAGTNVTITRRYNVYSTGGLNYFGNSTVSSVGAVANAAVHIHTNSSSGHSGKITFGNVPATATYALASIEFIHGNPTGSGNGTLAFYVRDLTTDSAPLIRLSLDPDGAVTIGKSAQAAYGALDTASGAVFDIAGGVTITDTSTAASGTVVHGAINRIGQHTLAATNTGVTYTNASTLYIADAPAAGTNVTISKRYGLYSAAVNNYFADLAIGSGTDMNLSTLTGTGYGGKLLIQAGGSNTRGAFSGANVIIEMGTSTTPPFKGGIAWGYTNNGANTNAWGAIQMETTSSTGNGYGDMYFMTRNVTTDTVPTTRLTLTADGNALFTNALSKIYSITASVAANALTVTLNPCALDFRSATLTSGTVNTRAVPSAISVVVPSGATLGTVSGQKSRIIVLAIDNAGTVELAVVNISGGSALDETGLITTAAISGVSLSNSVYYSTTSRTSVAYRVVGYVESTQTTAGTWATAPSTIQGAGGNALNAMSSLGYGQTWQDVTASRAFGTTYYNTTGKPIQMAVYGQQVASGNISVNCGGASNILVAYTAFNTTNGAFNFTVPAGMSYSVSTSTATLTSWWELR